MKIHHLGNYALSFINRKIWKATLSKNGEDIAIVPVTWDEDVAHDHVWIHLQNSNDTEKYKVEKEPYKVAIAAKKNNHASSAGFDRFVALYEVVSTNESAGNNIRAKIVKVLATAGNFQQTKKITRISFNDSNWRHPTGNARKLENKGTYNHDNGFGLEDWLFRNEWVIAGWRYAFLQGVNKSSKKLALSSLDISLFTINPERQRVLIADIKDLECLNETQSREVLKIYEKNGWLDIMHQEIVKVNGNSAALINDERTLNIFNVRFRIENVQFYPDDSILEKDDPIEKYKRYSLYDIPHNIFEKQTNHIFRGRVGSKNLPVISSHTRHSKEAYITVTPEHQIMQRTLMQKLQRELSDKGYKFNEYEIFQERHFVDVSAENKENLRLYEIKTDLNPRIVIRKAIGQLLEYAYHGKFDVNKKIHLIAVGRSELSSSDNDYIQTLQSRFSIPIEYLTVKIENSAQLSANM